MGIRPRILVSLHDVWPGNFALADRELQWLRERGASAPAILAVPCYHGKRPLEEEPAFTEWLRGQEKSGAAIFAHGYRHLRAENLGESTRRSPWGNWRNRAAKDEGEFAGLPPQESGVLLNQAFSHFKKAGLNPVGWAFPAWMGRIPAGFSLPESCRFVDARFSVTDWGLKNVQWAPALTFGQSSGKRFAYGGRLWRQYLLRTGLARIALHPGDLGHENVRLNVEELLAKGNAVAYADAF
jgi:hypothetical protein